MPSCVAARVSRRTCTIAGQKTLGGWQEAAGWRYSPGRHLGRGHDLRREATALKEVVADLTLENRLLKKSVTADGEDGE